MFEKIVVPVEISDRSAVLIQNLEGMKDFGAKEFLLIKIVGTRESEAIALSYSIGNMEEGLQEQKEVLEAQGYRVETRIVTGIAKNELSKIAENEGYDLVMIGAETQSRFSEFFLGGLAHEILPYANRPVLIARLQRAEDEEEAIRCISCHTSHHVLLATDFSDSAKEAFEIVKKMVKSGVKRVTLAHVQDKSQIDKYLKDRLDEFNKTDAARLETLKQELTQTADVEVDIDIVYGKPGPEIVRLAKEKNAKMIVMGIQGKGHAKEAFVGSVSNYVARQADASVLVTPAKKRD